MIWDWDFTKELGLGSCFVSSQFSIANNGSCTRMFKKRVEVIAFNQCWRDCQCAFHPPWERTSDTTIDHHPPQEPTKDHRMTRWTKSRLRGQLVSIRYIQLDSLLNSSQPRTQTQTEFINSRATISLVCIAVNDTGIDRMDITNS